MSGQVVGYPSRRELSSADMTEVLRRGAPLPWFAPFAVPGEVRTARPDRMPYGVVHWYLDADGKPRSVVHTYRDEEDARWALDWLYTRHQDGCHCVAVFYWTPATVSCRGEADS